MRMKVMIHNHLLSWLKSQIIKENVQGMKADGAEHRTTEREQWIK